MLSTTYKFYSSKNNNSSNLGENGDAESSFDAVTSATNNSSSIIPAKKSDFFNKTVVIKNGNKTNSLNMSRLNSKHIASAKKKAMNASVLRQTLRSNNKALARALELAKNEIKLLKEENLLLKSTNQELQTQLIRHQDVDSFEELFEKAVDECVKSKLADIFTDVETLVDETAQTLVQQTNYMSQLSKICKKHIDGEESATPANKRMSSVESSADEFVRRYSSRQPTIFGARRSMAVVNQQPGQSTIVDKQLSDPSDDKPSTSSVDSIRKLSRRSDLFIRSSDKPSSSSIDSVKKSSADSVRKSSRRSDLFKRPPEPVTVRKPFDLSTLLEQSSMIDVSMANEDTVPISYVPLETVSESPKNLSPISDVSRESIAKRKRRTSVFGTSSFNQLPDKIEAKPFVIESPHVPATESPKTSPVPVTEVIKHLSDASETSRQSTVKRQRKTSAMIKTSFKQPETIVTVPIVTDSPNNSSPVPEPPRESTVKRNRTTSARNERKSSKQPETIATSPIGRPKRSVAKVCYTELPIGVFQKTSSRRSRWI